MVGRKPCKNPRRSRKTEKKGGTAINFSEGPFDTTNHIFLDEYEIKKHIDDMQRRKEQLRAIKDEYASKYEKELAERNQQNQTDESLQREKRAEEFQMRMQVSQQDAEEAKIAAQAAGETIEKAMTGAYTFVKEGLTGLWSLIKGTGSGVNELGKRSGGEICITLLKGFIAILIILFVIGLIICIFLWGFGVFTKPAPNGSGTSSSSNFFGPEIVFNVFTGIDGASNQTVSTVIEKANETIKPNFDAIKQMTKQSLDEILKNPTSFLTDYVKSWYDKFITSDPLKSLLLYANYMKNFMFFSLQSLSGGSMYDKFTNTKPREAITTGRCDNIIYLESSIFPKKLLREKNIDTNNTVINLNKPMDIEWTLPELDYNGLDVSKLPPSLVSKKNSNGVSLQDKKTVTIPWITKNNHYVLSCENAYFNSNKEKAHLLIDVNDDTSCTFNNQSTPHVFREDKKRYASTNDYSMFI